MLFAAHPSSINTDHRGQSGGRGLSPRIWDHMGTDLNPDGAGGWFGHYDDFLGLQYLAATGALPGSQNWGFIENSGTIKQLATEVGGVIQLASGTTADNDCIISTGGDATAGNSSGIVKVGVGVPGTLTSIGTKVLFEARVRWESVTTSASQFVGLVEHARTLNDGLITDSHVVGQIDHIGFYVMDDDADSLNFGYGSNGQTVVEKIADIQALTAATWYKVGFVYDPAAASANRIRVYVDNVENGTKVTETNIAAITFPGGEELALFAQAKTDTTTASLLDIDWWATAQGS